MSNGTERITFNKLAERVLKLGIGESIDIWAEDYETGGYMIKRLKEADTDFYILTYYGGGNFYAVEFTSEFKECYESQLEYMIGELKSAWKSFGEYVIYIKADDEISGYLNDEYDRLLDYTYEIYKHEWCNERGYTLGNEDDEHGFNGECYVCKKEFEGCVFTDKAYIDGRLNGDDFEIWCACLDK